MNATDLEAFVDALIDDLTPASPPDDAAERRLFDLLDCPRRVVDEQSLLAVLVAAVTARNLVDHVIAQAVAAAGGQEGPRDRHRQSLDSTAG